jgi:hypothetical protein
VAVLERQAAITLPGKKSWYFFLPLDESPDGNEEAEREDAKINKRSTSQRTSSSYSHLCTTPYGRMKKKVFLA